MNEKLFKPRGLYAMIMAYKPGSTEEAAIVDLQTNVAVSAATGAETKGWFGVSSGTTYDENCMPLSAPLTFPDLENGKKKATTFLSDYSDRRAQALWVRWVTLSRSCRANEVLGFKQSKFIIERTTRGEVRLKVVRPESSGQPWRSALCSNRWQIFAWCKEIWRTKSQESCRKSSWRWSWEGRRTKGSEEKIARGK